MGKELRMVMMGFLVMVVGMGTVGIEGALSARATESLGTVNRKGPYLGIVLPNYYEMLPILQAPSYVPDDEVSSIDVAGKRFRIGKLETKKIIIVMTGLSMLNAGISTQLLLSLFKIRGVLHYGIAGNANPNFQIGDVTIPRYWAHTGLWNWQRYGDGPEDELSLESEGDYTRDLGYLKFSDFKNNSETSNPSDNLLNNVWFQPEEVFPVRGEPEAREHAFWIPVNENYYAIAEKLKDMKLENCVNSTCLPRPPIVTTVEKGGSATVFVDNGGYREFLYSKFNVTPIDLESAAVALVCFQRNKPFIVIRALSDLAGGGSAVSNEAIIFASLAAENSVLVALRFVALLFS